MTFTELVQKYFVKKQKQQIIDHIVEKLTYSFEKQARELAEKLYEKYEVQIITKENKDETITAYTVIRPGAIYTQKETSK